MYLCVCVYIYVYHIFFIHSSVDGHLGCSHSLGIVNNAGGERQILYVITYTWILKYKTNKCI